jgi:hypothetical protein
VRARKHQRTDAETRLAFHDIWFLLGFLPPLGCSFAGPRAIDDRLAQRVLEAIQAKVLSMDEAIAVNVAKLPELFTRN